MNNTFIQNLVDNYNYKYTENGATALISSGSAVYDMFALGGAYRNRNKVDKILLFKSAFEENPDLALKCLFYLRDVRGGQGEREFFRVCFKWLAKNEYEIAKNLLAEIPVFGRWDDIIPLIDVKNNNFDKNVFNLIKNQLFADMSETENVSLLAKWLPSENATKKYTRIMGGKVRRGLGLTTKQYRKMLSKLRSRINIVEKLMSENRWEDIEFDKLPSKAGLIYKYAFQRHCGSRYYNDFILNETKTVNAGTLYPYEIVHQAFHTLERGDEVQREVVNKYWENLPDYFEGKPSNMICVIDTSGSMEGRPIEVATSLGIYAAERNEGPFKNYFITFASRPELVKIKGIDFVDKARRIKDRWLIDNTNLEAVFDLLLNTAIKENVNPEDIPKTIVIISDMEIDAGSTDFNSYSMSTTMSRIRKKWAQKSCKMPKIVYWNVDARQDTILDVGPDVTLVSGFSPIIFKMVLTGKTGMDLMMDTLMSDRYKKIKATP